MSIILLYVNITGIILTTEEKEGGSNLFQKTKNKDINYIKINKIIRFSNYSTRAIFFNLSPSELVKGRTSHSRRLFQVLPNFFFWELQCDAT